MNEINVSAHIESFTEKLPALTPVISPWMKKLVNHEHHDLFSLIDTYGSPVNIQVLSAFDQNIDEFTALLNSYPLKHKIFYARKANKCKAFVKRSKEKGIGVDTASYRELEEALEANVPTKDIVVTAAIKNRKLLQLAISNDVLLVLDNADEFEQTNQIATDLDKRARIGVRISGFFVESGKLYSRFGFDVAEVEEFLAEELVNNKKYQQLDYEGIHFHLNGYSMTDRSEAIKTSIYLADRLNRYGLKTNFIDIGGGFLMNYLSDEQEWLDFQETLKKAVKKEHRNITFQNNGLGYTLVDGVVQGKLNTYPYYNNTPRTKFLSQILDKEVDYKLTISDLLKRRDIELRMEPGRSLLDQAGVTMARVAFRKKDSNNDILVGLDMNMTQMHSSSADFLLDPFVVYQNEDPNAIGVEVYFTGAYCLERDIILKRKIRLAQLPEIDDLVIFVNTAGYMMHFFESEAHLFHLASNLILKENHSETLLERVQPDAS